MHEGALRIATNSPELARSSSHEGRVPRNPWRIHALLCPTDPTERRRALGEPRGREVGTLGSQRVVLIVSDGVGAARPATAATNVVATDPHSSHASRPTIARWRAVLYRRSGESRRRPPPGEPDFTGADRPPPTKRSSNPSDVLMAWMSASGGSANVPDPTEEPHDCLGHSFCKECRLGGAHHDVHGTASAPTECRCPECAPRTRIPHPPDTG